MKGKVILFLILSVILALFASPFFESFLGENYDYSASLASIGGSFVLEGILFGYVFFSSFLIYLVTSRAFSGVIVAFPVLLFDMVTGAIRSHLWTDLLLLALGLGLAWLILKLKTRIVQKSDTNKNG